MQRWKGLPAKDRPEEWSKWTGKFRRAYANTPQISDPMEFGLAVTKYWKGIQPEVRQSSTNDLPLAIAQCPAGPIGKDIWASVRKGGANGILVVMTLLVWWGQCARLCNPWQEDSLPLWQACVADVQSCIALMTDTATTQRGRKRVSLTDDAAGEKR
ncbi:hypothetical protein C0991_010685 [Blastosporella zonata]|nr:hypothetical protein C0991_010685 [Blastosporella zonata]